MAGRNGFCGKAFCMFMNMDKMVGKDFEAGLAGWRPIGAARIQRDPLAREGR